MARCFVLSLYYHVMYSYTCSSNARAQAMLDVYHRAEHTAAIVAISGDYPAMGLGWGACTAYIHEILIVILKWTRDDIKIIMISLYSRENAALKSQVTRVGLAHARPIMYNRVLHSQHTMNVRTLCICT